MRLHLEKQAKVDVGKIISGLAKGVGKATEKTTKFVLDDPGRALAITGAGALGLGASAAAIGLSHRFHDMYNITSEMRKRKVIKQQMLPTLREIARNTRKEAPPAMPMKQKIIIPPLS